jgi:hypothetical protein
MSLRPIVIAAAALVACAPAPKSSGTPAARVRIVAPDEGSTVSVPFVIRLEAEGIAVAPADGQRTPGQGHHHLFFDADVTPGDSVIPKTAQIIHLGSGATEFTVEALEPGPHRIIAIFADGAHIPLASVVPDTLNVVVAPLPGATP